MRHFFHPDARAELFAAAARYERELAGLGGQFHHRVQQAIAAITALPRAAPLWPGLAIAAPVRRQLVRQFPFALAYILDTEPNALTIIAVAHLKRQPAYWSQRLLH